MSLRFGRVSLAVTSHRRSLTLIATLPLLLLAVLQCAVAAPEDAAALAAPALATSSAQAAEPRLLQISEGGPVYLRDLDDPANPWRGQYSELDRWIVAHLLSKVQELALQTQPPRGRLYYPIDPPSGIRDSFVDALADGQGFLIPQVVQRCEGTPRLSTLPLSAWTSMGLWEPPAARSPEEELQRSQRIHLVAQGPLEQSLLLDVENERIRRDAASYMPIPGWLGQNPPLYTVLVPNGDVLCYGPLGLRISGLEPRDSSQRFVTLLEPCGELWYRYSQEGELLGTYDLGPWPDPSGWEAIYWRGWKDYRQQYMQASNAEHRSRYRMSAEGGYTGVVDFGEAGLPDSDSGLGSPGGKLLAVRDYDGTPMDTGIVPTRQRLNCGQSIDANMLTQIYQGQLAAGLTSAAGSPYAGTERGPRVADPPVQPRRVIAEKGQNFSRKWDGDYDPGLPVDKPRDWRAVRPLDDPANPYQAEYGPLDRWIVEHAGMMDVMADGSYRVGGDDYHGTDGWRYITAYCDADGKLLPKGHISPPPPPVDLRTADPWAERADLYSFNAGGVLPQELAAELERLQLASQMRTLPPIPDWLARQPVARAVFMPNGEVITYGALGSYDPAREGKARYLEGFKKSWYRYSAAGELLGSLPADEGSYLALYNPALLQVISNANALGYEMGGGTGVLIYRDATTHELISAYNWQGESLDLNQPIYGVAAGYCQYFDWDYIARIYQARQTAGPAGAGGAG